MVYQPKVLHLSEITRFSNYAGLEFNMESVFYTYLKLQGSQTDLTKSVSLIWFYTYLKLQGSQT